MTATKFRFKSIDRSTCFCNPTQSTKNNSKIKTPKTQTQCASNHIETGSIINNMPSSIIEVQSLLCRHCLKHHLNKQHDLMKINPKECIANTRIPPTNPKFVPFATTWKKLTKNHTPPSPSPPPPPSALINPNDDNNGNTFMVNGTIAEQLNGFRQYENGASILNMTQTTTTTTTAMSADKANGDINPFNDGANSLNTIGAQQFVCLRNSTDSNKMSGLNQKCRHSNCNPNRQKTSMKQTTINPIFSQHHSNNAFNEQSIVKSCTAIERLKSGDGQQSNERINSKCSFHTIDSNKSDTWFNANSNSITKQRPKSHVHTTTADAVAVAGTTMCRKNRCSPTIPSPTMKYSHVLLLCLSFIVFGIRNTLVLADITPANAASTNATETGSECYIFSLYFLLFSLPIFSS